MKNANRKARLILRRMKLLLAFAQKENELLRKEINSLPEGCLQIKLNHGSFGCYARNGSKINSIPRNSAKAKLLARKTIAKYELDSMEGLVVALEEAIRTVEHICMAEQSGAGKFTRMRISELFRERNYYLTQRERKWLNGLGKAKNFYPEQLKFKTEKGLMVRSKSEMIIANMLDELEVLYAYEPRININGRTIVPDFVIYRADGQIIIWEHFGLMSDPIYRQRAAEKIELYKEIGYHQNTNLICTDESDIERPESIRRIIDERIMRP